MSREPCLFDLNLQHSATCSLCALVFDQLSEAGLQNRLDVPQADDHIENYNCIRIRISGKEKGIVEYNMNVEPLVSCLDVFLLLVDLPQISVADQRTKSSKYFLKEL